MMFERRLEERKSSSPGMISGTAEGRASTVEDTEGESGACLLWSVATNGLNRAAFVPRFVRQKKVFQTWTRGEGEVETADRIYAPWESESVA